MVLPCSHPCTISRSAPQNSFDVVPKIREALELNFPSYDVVEFLGQGPILQQLQEFATASLIVGPHGAGLTNMIVSPLHTPVLEIGPLQCPVCYLHLAIKVKYRFAVARNSLSRIFATLLNLCALVKGCFVLIGQIKNHRFSVLSFGYCRNTAYSRRLGHLQGGLLVWRHPNKNVWFARKNCRTLLAIEASSRLPIGGSTQRLCWNGGVTARSASQTRSASLFVSSS